MKKCLIISDIYFECPQQLKEYEIIRLGFLKKVNRMGKYKRAFYLRTNNTKQFDFFTIEEASKIAPNTDIVILFDGTKNRILSEFAKQIEKVIDPQIIRLIFYFWNTIISSEGLQLSPKWEINTFDKRDAIKYAYRYVGGFYNCLFSENIIDTTSDVFFIGVNKGRFDFIKSLQTILIENNLTTDFIYVDNVKSLYNSQYSKFMPYAEILTRCNKSKAILDVVKSNQFGLTLRVYEGIFMNKKIITTNDNILQYKFYNPQNILLLNPTTSINVIKEFLNTPIVPYSDQIKQTYSFESWITRIIDLNIHFNDTNS